MGAGTVYLQCFLERGGTVQPAMFLGAGKGSTRDKLLIK
jgi:hypothetical protein